MHTFRVWAPKAHSVLVRTGGADHPMTKAAGGWWTAMVESARPGMDYAFIVDGSKPLPDPRSPSQPCGVHGVSRLVNHAAFPWTDAHFQPPPLAAGIAYELHIGTFTPKGTFDSAIERLDHLQRLGATHVELMPVAEFSGDWGWGYDGVDLYAPHHAYGKPEALKRFVDACHTRGLAVILDVVYNHLGPTGNYLGQFGPYFTDRYFTPWGAAVNLDGAGSDEVRTFFIDNAVMWLRDYHFDGLRLDAIHALLDRSAVHLLEQLAAAVHQLEAETGRHKFLIAESDLNDPRIVRSVEAGGYGIHAQWSDDFHHAIHSALTGETSGYYEDFGGTAKIIKALCSTFVYDGDYSAHRGRTHGRPVAGVSSHRFVTYSQTHDQVGNRARGERLVHLTGLARAKAAAALVLTAPFIPMLFQGEEWAASAPFQYFTHHEEEGLARAVSEGRRREFASFGWNPEQVPDPQDPETFKRSHLDWDEIDKDPHREMLEWYRALIRLRKSEPALLAPRQHDFQASVVDDLISVRRGPVQIFVNLSAQTRSVPANDYHMLLASHADLVIQPTSVALPPDATLILRMRS